ncbi:MAG: 3-oxoacyl-ACP reductase FabG [Syntrophales bacterium]|nr:3-oxoacyl-ACP reductase FabG [Syntrophales bacterium]
MMVAVKKLAVVTGGSKGIGRAVCIELAKAGYDIVVNYRSDEQGAAETLQAVIEQGAGGKTMRFDVSNRDETQEAVREITGSYESVDVLVNNAGIHADGLFVMMPHEDWDAVIDTTLSGFYNVTRFLLEKMIFQKHGSIVSISSVAALIGNRGQANYAAAKAGLIGASRALASEVARLGVRVNVVAPGLIETEMIKGAPIENIKAVIPMARTGKPEEVARVVRFLCSDDASYMTGQVISVNGGMF